MSEFVEARQKFKRNEQPAELLPKNLPDSVSEPTTWPPRRAASSWSTTSSTVPLSVKFLVVSDLKFYDKGVILVDLGDDFVSFAMLTAAEGKSLETASQLDCESFDQKCRWRSGGESTAVFLFVFVAKIEWH